MTDEVVISYNDKAIFDIDLHLFGQDASGDIRSPEAVERGMQLAQAMVSALNSAEVTAFVQRGLDE